MKSNDLIDALVLDYDHYRKRRVEAALRLDHERVADMDTQLEKTRRKLDAVMQVMQDEKYLDGKAGLKRSSGNMECHELMLWADAGYPPVAAEPRLVEHERPLSGWAIYKCDDVRSKSEYIGPQEPTVKDEYIVPMNPTAADWRRVAARYVETGKKEHYNLMLSVVRLDHPAPNLWAESETVKITGKTDKPLTPEDVWHCIKGRPLIVGVILIALLVFFIALNGV